MFSPRSPFPVKLLDDYRCWLNISRLRTYDRFKVHFGFAINITNRVPAAETARLYSIFHNSDSQPLPLWLCKSKPTSCSTSPYCVKLTPRWAQLRELYLLPSTTSLSLMHVHDTAEKPPCCGCCILHLITICRNISSTKVHNVVARQQSLPRNQGE
jgi:hypothetical protein